MISQTQCNHLNGLFSPSRARKLNQNKLASDVSIFFDELLLLLLFVLSKCQLAKLISQNIFLSLSLCRTANCEIHMTIDLQAKWMLIETYEKLTIYKRKFFHRIFTREKSVLKYVKSDSWKRNLVAGKFA